VAETEPQPRVVAAPVVVIGAPDHLQDLEIVISALDDVPIAAIRLTPRALPDFAIEDFVGIEVLRA
jgi:hypothetical protein